MKGTPLENCKRTGVFGVVISSAIDEKNYVNGFMVGLKEVNHKYNQNRPMQHSLGRGLEARRKLLKELDGLSYEVGYESACLWAHKYASGLERLYWTAADLTQIECAVHGASYGTFPQIGRGRQSFCICTDKVQINAAARGVSKALREHAQLEALTKQANVAERSRKARIKTSAR